MKQIRNASALALLVIAACSPLPLDKDTRWDTRACEQTYEFENTGCADIEGSVLGVANQLLSGVSVGPRYLAGRDGFNTPYATTDSDGRFHLRITRFGGLPPVVGPDTMSLFIVAFYPNPTSARDSVLAHVIVAPLGEPPAPVIVTLRLPYN